MHSRKTYKLLFLILIPLVLGLVFLHECSFTGGMGAAAKNCDCAGYGWLLFDGSASDGPRKTVCIGIVKAVKHYQYIDRPTEESNFSTGVTLKTDKEIYAPGESIQLEITNNLESPIRYYGFCSLNLCQRRREEWFCEVKDCVASMIVINAGSSITLTEQAIDLAETGLKYHFEYQTIDDDTLYTIDSNEFAIQQE